MLFYATFNNIVSEVYMVSVMVFYATFNNIWRKQEYPEKTTDLSLTNLYIYNVVSSTSHHERDSNSQL